MLLDIELNPQPLKLLQLNSWCFSDTSLGSDKAASLTIKHWIWHTKDKWELLIESCSTFAALYGNVGSFPSPCQVPENNGPYPSLISMGYLHKLFKSYIWKLE